MFSQENRASLARAVFCSIDKLVVIFMMIKILLLCDLDIRESGRGSTSIKSKQKSLGYVNPGSESNRYK